MHTKLVVVGVAVVAGCCFTASLGLVPFLPAYVAPMLSWKLRMLPLAFVGWRLGRISFTFFFVRLAFSFSFRLRF